MRGEGDLVALEAQEPGRRATEREVGVHHDDSTICRRYDPPVLRSLPRCLSCDAELQGRFCHRCGQEAVDHRVPLRVLVGDALGDLLAFDSRILRTLRPLFLRPGFLTAEWCRGRRVPYVPPLRLYLFVGAAFFLVLAATDSSLVVIRDEEAATLDTAAKGTGPAGAEPAAPEASGERTWLDRLFESRMRPALMRGPEVFQDRFVDRLGRLSLLLPPVFGLLVALVYRRRRRFLVEHLMFSFHFHCFAFLVVAVVALVPAGAWRGLAALALTILVAYLFLALRRVYGGRRWVAAGRVAALALAYLLLVLLPVMMLALVWTLLAG